MKNDNSHRPDERAAARWWRKTHPEHANTRLLLVHHDGTAFSYLVEPKPEGQWRSRTIDRAVVSLEEMVDTYAPVRAAALARINAKQNATGIIVNVTEADIVREALRGKPVAP